MNTIWHPLLPDDAGPKYLSLARLLREAIRAGDLPCGSKLPTVRDLAWRISVTPGTVSRAYQIVTQEGLLEATVGRGTFVAALSPRLGPRRDGRNPLIAERDLRNSPDLLDLRSPHVPEVGQGEVFAEALRRMADQTAAGWLDYPTQMGERDLRQMVCDWLGDRVLGGFNGQDIVLTNGGQNGVGLILSCCLRGDRPVVLTEDLSYPGFRYAARLARAEVVGIEMDAEGILPDALDAACRKHGAQVLCVTPETQNPTTARMGAARRADIVAVARRHDLQIIEDECYQLPDSDSPALRALAPERVWYLGSLSKSISAALRLGYIVCPTGMGEIGRIAAQHGYFGLSRPVTQLATDLFATGAAQIIRDRVRADYVRRVELVVNRLGVYDLGWQAGMPFVWLRMPQGWRASTFARMAEEAGVLLRSADQYAMSSGRVPNAVRIAVAGHVPLDRLTDGIEALAQLLANPPTDLAV